MHLLITIDHCGGSDGMDGSDEDAGSLVCLLTTTGHYGGSDEAGSSVCLLATSRHISVT